MIKSKYFVICLDVEEDLGVAEILIYAPQLLQIFMQAILAVLTSGYLFYKILGMKARTLKKVIIIMLLLRVFGALVPIDMLGILYSDELWFNTMVILLIPTTFLLVLGVLKVYGKKSYIKIFITLVLSDCCAAIFVMPISIILLGIKYDMWDAILTPKLSWYTIVVYCAQILCTIIGLKAFDRVLNYITERQLEDSWKSSIVIGLFIITSIVANIQASIELKESMISIMLMSLVVCGSIALL